MQLQHLSNPVPPPEPMIAAQVLIVPPETPVEAVLAQMGWDPSSSEAQSSLAASDPSRPPPGYALVVANSQLLGIFTAQDAIRLITSGQTLTGLTIAEVMAGQITDSPLQNRDRQPTSASLSQQLERERLISAIAQRIRESLDLEVILNRTVAEVQQLLLADRVLVYRVWPDHTGSTIAEATAPGWVKILEMPLPPEVFSEECYQPYLQGQIYTLTDREQEPISPYLQELLAQMQVRAKLVVPIIQQDHLWGLLIVHQCSRSRQWQAWEIELLKQLATQLAIAIQQAHLYSQVQRELSDRKRLEAQLQVALAEKELLLKETHHRVKNNLQVISSIFSLQSQTTNDPEILAILRDNQNRITSIALVHTKLYQSESLANIRFADYLQSLVSELFMTYNVNPARVRLQLQVADVSLDPDTAITCGLLLNELVSNALKHAFPDGTQGEIQISLTETKQGQLCLRVADNGIGLATDPQTQPQSLGLRLIRALIRQLKGELEIQASPGARFQVTFPSPPQCPKV